MKKPILCLDFDGVIHSYKSRWQGASVIPDPPVTGALEFILAALDGGFDVHIFSSRSKNIFGRWAMKRWLAKYLGEMWVRGSNSVSYAEAECLGDAQDLVNRLKFPWFKPSAMVTIDDRAIQFNGTWPTLDSIRNFKPWNKP